MSGIKKLSLLAAAVFILAAGAAPDLDREKSIRMPHNRSDWTGVSWYEEWDPDPDYQHAPESAYESFYDTKFGVRIHWGIYSIKELQKESWPFLEMSNQERQQYQELYQTWNPAGFDAEQWMDLFEKSGIRLMAFTTKHHEGFSMWDTKTRVKKRARWWPGPPHLEDCDLAYSIMETRFKRDVVRELTEAARRHKIKIDLYFSHPDWYDADFRPYMDNPMKTWASLFLPFKYSAIPRSRMALFPGPTKAETMRAMKRHREQLIELLTNYGKIDMLCLDLALGPDTWPYLKETIKILRQIQPEVMFRNRGIANYGDYYTPEGYVPGDPANTAMPWMVIYPLARSFSYDPDAAKYKGANWIIDNLVDIAAKGGVFMVGIGPDGNGKFHPEAERQLLETGKWLQVNGEAIYGTRMWTSWKEGDRTRFTRTKDNKYVYAITTAWPGSVFKTSLVKPRPGSKIFMLGIKEPLNWTMQNNTLVIEIPEAVSNNRPCDYAWAFKIDQAGSSSSDRLVLHTRAGKEFKTINWNPKETAIIITDMWDQHWCRSATERVAELAPAINEFVKAGRDQGVFIIHAPSETMDFYQDHPARLRAENAPRARNLPAHINEPCRWVGNKLLLERGVYDLDRGCDQPCGDKKCEPHQAWSRQIPAIEIDEGRDAISDSGEEIWNLMEERGIKNVILVGVHANMCIINRPFGLCNLKRQGINAVLARDLTDAMYNPEYPPFVDHFTGVDRVVAYIEKYLAPTILSTDITGKPPFKFKDDQRTVAK